VAESETSEVRGLAGLFARLAGAESHPAMPQLVTRVRRVLRLDADVYREIESDRGALPEAVVIVIATALLAGIGQGSPVFVFLGVAWALFAWLMSAALIWSVATIVLARTVDYPRLLAGVGYAYAWMSLMVLARLPGYLGALVSVAAIGLCFAAFVQATERALEVPTERALVICGSALALPFLLLLLALL
jgi:hypothetical protein